MSNNGDRPTGKQRPHRPEIHHHRDDHARSAAAGGRVEREQPTAATLASAPTTALATTETASGMAPLVEPSATEKVIAENRTPVATVEVRGAANGRAAAEEARAVSLRDVRSNDKVRAYIEKANEQMNAIGYSEHGLRHAGLVAAIARNICLELGYETRSAELAAIAGYLHDIGNCVHRAYHPQIGATMAFQLLDQMGMQAAEIATVIGAIGNHEEPEGEPINTVTAAVIIADKSDVHFTRVQNPDPTTYDIHDRVNHAVQKSYLLVDRAAKTLTLDLVIDLKEASVMEYFEIFVHRMAMCRKAAEKLGCQFRLIINATEL